MNIDQAKQYLLKNVIPKFEDKSFEHYVINRLAGDFAVEIANMFDKLITQIRHNEQNLILIFALLTENSGEVYEDADQAFSVIKQKLSDENYNDCPYCGEFGNKAEEQ